MGIKREWDGNRKGISWDNEFVGMMSLLKWLVVWDGELVGMVGMVGNRNRKGMGIKREWE